MTFDEMCSFTVDGGKATCDLLGNGFIEYPFDGWYIAFPSGSSSKINFDDKLKAADWREYEPPKKAWADLPKIAPKAPVTAPKRRGRPPKPALPINDIGDWQKPKPAAINPWAEIRAKQGLE